MGGVIIKNKEKKVAGKIKSNKQKRQVIAV